MFVSLYEIICWQNVQQMHSIFMIKGPENQQSNVMPTVFHIWSWGPQSCVAPCDNTDESVFIFY